MRVRGYGYKLVARGTLALLLSAYLYMPHGQSAQSHCELRAPGGAARPGGHRVAEHCLLEAESTRAGGGQVEQTAREYKQTRNNSHTRTAQHLRCVKSGDLLLLAETVSPDYAFRAVLAGQVELPLIARGYQAAEAYGGEAQRGDRQERGRSSGHHLLRH